MFGLPWWLVACMAGILALPFSVVIPLVGLKLWQWFVERDQHRPERKPLDTLFE